MLLLPLVSCERNGQPRSPEQGKTELKETSVTPPPKEGDDAVLIEKKPPVAEPVPGQPGMVISPYNGKPIDVKGIAPGTLVADPTYPMEQKKYFRVPEPPKLLDPTDLIRPTPAKEDREDEEAQKEEP
jgi:hypothetical protein